MEWLLLEKLEVKGKNPFVSSLFLILKPTQFSSPQLIEHFVFRTCLNGVSSFAEEYVWIKVSSITFGSIAARTVFC
jgi:hypothetical protein